MKQIWVKRQDVEKVNNDITVTDCILEKDFIVLSEESSSDWIAVYVTEEYIDRIKKTFTLTENKKVILG